MLFSLFFWFVCSRELQLSHTYHPTRFTHRLPPSLSGWRTTTSWMKFSWRHCCSSYAVSISTVRHIHQCALDVYLHVCVDGPSAVRLARLASSQNISSKTRRGRKNQKRTVDGGIKPVTRASNKFFFFGLYFLSSGLCVCVCVLFLWM
jgi:hypothetical protein